MTEEKMHYAKTELSDQIYQVSYKGDVVVESGNVVLLKEHYKGKDFPPVFYFPPNVLGGLGASKTDHGSVCPIKGQASYWSYKDAENGIWSYENPNDDMSQIKDHFGFDQKKGFRVKRKT